jgi:hypothetical protein
MITKKDNAQAGDDSSKAENILLALMSINTQ